MTSEYLRKSVVVACLAAASMTMMACGQTGALYLPDDDNGEVVVGEQNEEDDDET